MKIVYIFCLIIIGSFNAVAQELNFNDLIYLYTNSLDLDKCDTYLAKKNFTYLEYKEGRYVFTQNRKQNKTADAFVTLRTTSVSLQSSKRTTYDYFKQIAATYKLKMTKNGADDLGNMVITYESEKYYLSLSQGLDEGGSGKTYYLIFFAMW